MPILLAIKRTAWTLAFITADAETIAVELYSSAMAVIAGIWLIANSQILYKIQSFGNLYWWGTSFIVIGSIQLINLSWGITFRRWLALFACAMWASLAASIHHENPALLIIPFLAVLGVVKFWVFWRLGVRHDRK